MIVVDSNVIAYCWIRGPLTPVAQQLRVADPDWHVPYSVAFRAAQHPDAEYLRTESLEVVHARRIMAATEAALAGREHLIDSDAVIDVVQGTKLSAYDAEFVALARTMSAPLVTADRSILRAASDVARTMEDQLAAR